MSSCQREADAECDITMFAIRVLEHVQPNSLKEYDLFDEAEASREPYTSKSLNLLSNNLKQLLLDIYVMLSALLGQQKIDFQTLLFQQKLNVTEKYVCMCQGGKCGCNGR